MVDRLPGEVGPVKWNEVCQTEMGDTVLSVGGLTVVNHGEQPPALFIYPKTNWNREIVIWLTDTGKAGLSGSDRKLLPSITALARKGCGIASVDLFGQGEFVGSGSGAVTSVRMMAKGKAEQPYEKSAGYTFGYNPPFLVQRAHHVMSLLEFLRRDDGPITDSTAGKTGRCSRA